MEHQEELELRHTCVNCEEKFDKEDGQFADGEFYCEDCFGDNFIICEECEEPVEISDATEIHGSFYCEDCRDNNFTQCYGCDEWLDSNGYTGADGNTYCENCWSDNYGTCEECGDTYDLDDLRYSEHRGAYYCDGCHRESDIIEDYSYRPSPIFGRLKYEKKKNLYFGFELEVECGDDRESQAESFLEWLSKNKIEENFYFKEDSSLDNGFEIVSHPMTRKYIHKHIKIKEMLEWLSKNGFTSYDNKNCGLHIHFSRDYLKDSDIVKLKTFFKVNEKHIRKFSKRREKDFDAWATIESAYTPDELLKGISAENNRRRHVAVNVNCDTVEIRVFAGTLNYKRFRASLQFADAVVNFIKDSSAVCLFNGRSWVEFLRYIKSNGQYEKLYRYLRKQKLGYGIMFSKTYSVKLSRERR
jgi:hypothetical protein